VRDWVKLAVTRARATGAPAVFWLDRDRAHDAELIKKLDRYLPEHDTTGLQIEVLAPVDATRLSLERIAKGEDTISVTGNALAARFAPLAERLAADETTIVDELNAVQGAPVDIGGYYFPDPAQASAAMRPSPTFNAALSLLG